MKEYITYAWTKYKHISLMLIVIFILAINRWYTGEVTLGFALLTVSAIGFLLIGSFRDVDKLLELADAVADNAAELSDENEGLRQEIDLLTDYPYKCPNCGDTHFEGSCHICHYEG